MNNADGSFAGCCYGTPCYDAGGDLMSDVPTTVKNGRDR